MKHRWCRTSAREGGGGYYKTANLSNRTNLYSVFMASFKPEAASTLSSWCTSWCMVVVMVHARFIIITRRTQVREQPHFRDFQATRLTHWKPCFTHALIVKRAFQRFFNRPTGLSGNASVFHRMTSALLRELSLLKNLTRTGATTKGRLKCLCL